MDEAVRDHIQSIAEADITEFDMTDVQWLIAAVNETNPMPQKVRNDLRKKLERMQNALHLAEGVRVKF